MKIEDDLYYDHMNSPLGIIHVIGSESYLYSIRFYSRKIKNRRTNKLLKEVLFQLSVYLKGDLKKFDLPCKLVGTDFQKRVWGQLKKIKLGKIKTYKEIASGIKDIKAARAVGSAIGFNSLPIIIPCHRVIASNGDISGFTAGIWRKKWLLKHEGILVKKDKIII